MTNKEIVEFFAQHPEMKSDPDFKAMFDKSSKEYYYECQPKANRVHDIYLKMIWECEHLIDIDPHCDLWGTSKEEYEIAVNKWREWKEGLIKKFKDRYAEELKETSAIEDGKKIKNGKNINDLLIVYDCVDDAVDYEII